MDDAMIKNGGVCVCAGGGNKGMQQVSHSRTIVWERD